MSLALDRRGVYLAALGIEALVLRGPVGAVEQGSGRIAGADAANAGESRAAPSAKRSTAPRAADNMSRSEGATHAAPENSAAAFDDGLFAPRAPRLALHSDGLTDFSGPHGRLLRAVVRAAGAAEAEVSFDRAVDVPALVFDASAPSALAASPASLRDPRAKRAAWPALRRLRRRLHGADT